MFRSLRARIVLLMILLIVLMMTVVGAFLINSVAWYQLEAFAAQMSKEFGQAELITSLQAFADQDNAPAQLKELLRAYSGALGIDTVQRNYYILDARSGAFLAGSDEDTGPSLGLTPTILRAMATGEAETSRRVGDAYMDAAVPITGDSGAYIIYIKDTKASMQALITQMFTIIVEALLVGLAVAVALSFIVSRAITNPLDNLTRSATLMAAGNFTRDLEVQSSDEIGELTRTFNHMAGVVRDTLEDVKAERDKLGTLFLHMSDGVAAFSAEGAPVQANPSAEELLGIPFAQMESYDHVFGDAAPLADVLEAGEPRFLQRDIDREDRALQVSVAPFGRPDVEGVMAVIHDVTEQKKLDSLRREFISNVSHELRTPLTNIQSYAETLHDTPDLPPETARSFSQVILNEAERMNRIVRDLLTLSRFDYGKMDWHIVRFKLGDMLRDVYDAMLLEARKKEHRLTLEFSSMLPEITADRERLEQVFVNILSNAIKYTPDGGVIDVAAGVENGEIRISVKDNGIGIPKKDISRVFERFYRVDKARSRQSGGSGLGLAIAREIIEKHRGAIDIDSAPGEGTTVTIRLPLEGSP